MSEEEQNNNSEKRVVGRSDSRMTYPDRTEVVEETYYSDNTKEIKTYTLSNRSLAASSVEYNEEENKKEDKTEN